MTKQNYEEFYRSLSDGELLKIAGGWPSLVDEAKPLLEKELARRRLELVEAIKESEESRGRFVDLVTIRHYRDLSEAIVARGVIESAGILCSLKDENLVRLDWQISNLIGGIGLQVPWEDIQAAEAILQQPIPETISLPDQPPFEQPIAHGAVPST